MENFFSLSFVLNNFLHFAGLFVKVTTWKVRTFNHPLGHMVGQMAAQGVEIFPLSSEKDLKSLIYLIDGRVAYYSPI
jgi:hypothetical protein